MYVQCMSFHRDYSLRTVTRLQEEYRSSIPGRVVSYGAEAWTLTKKEEQALLIFERKTFRRMYGPKYENGEWKSRTNREL